MVPSILGLLALLAQEPVLPSAPDELRPACVQVSCQGKRLEHTFGQFSFCVPRGMRARRVAGFEGDVRDLITIHHKGSSEELVVFSSTYGSANRTPDWLNNGSAQKGEASIHTWRCPEGAGGDYRLARGGRYSRFIQFPFGSAEYDGVSADTVGRFDRILDSLCCRPFPSAKH